MSNNEEKNQTVDKSKDTDREAEKEKTSEHGQENKDQSGSKGDQGSTDGGRNKQREFFKEELRRLQSSLHREATKIKKPTPQEHMPDIFTSLEPYYNTYTARFLIESTEGELPHGYNTRKTAIGLCDPWVDLSMDNDVLPPIAAKPSHTSPYGSTETKKQQQKDGTRKEGSNRKGKDGKADKQKPKERPQKEGSTRLPKYPVVTLETKEFATKKLYYSDVPKMRQELEEKYSSNSQQKRDEDYKRTKQDFYRMDLDRLDQVHQLSRPHMRKTYFAYLQNTPGSRKALYDCMKNMEKAQ